LNNVTSANAINKSKRHRAHGSRKRAKTRNRKQGRFNHENKESSRDTQRISNGENGTEKLEVKGET
jgi:hypothetical protein